MRVRNGMNFLRHGDEEEGRRRGRAGFIPMKKKMVILIKAAQWIQIKCTKARVLIKIVSRHSRLTRCCSFLFFETRRERNGIYEWNMEIKGSASINFKCLEEIFRKICIPPLV